MMKKIYTTSIFLTLAVLLHGQAVNYGQRYDLLVSQFGPAGVGVETVLDNWGKTDSTSVKYLTARFDYYLAKSRTSEVVKKNSDKYLGMKPILSLKDTTGTDVYYYQEDIYDDEIYGLALKAADKAIACHPASLDFRFMKANAYISYEKESPDMALAYLLALAVEDRSGVSWTFGEKEVERDFFADAMQEYCYSFYSIGSPDAMEAFRVLSEKMYAYYPENTGFLNNLGSYHMVAAKDYKAALKCYSKVLKKHKDDYIAIKNSMIAARKMKNVKLEKKYLSMLAEYGPEDEREQVLARLKALQKK